MDLTAVRGHVRMVTWLFADALVYASAVTLVTVGIGLIAGVVTGGGLVHTKYFLFLAGFVVMAIATAGLWPSRPESGHETMAGVPGLRRTKAVSDALDRTRFQLVIDESPPMRLLRVPPPNRRWSTSAKLLVASLLVLLCSFLMETVFDIAA